MRYPVIVRTKDDHEYEAEPVGIPELKIVAKTEDDALEKVGETLEQWLISAKVIQIVTGHLGCHWDDSKTA